MLSLVGGVRRSSRFCSDFPFELGGESPVLLLSSNSASLGYFNVVGDVVGGGKISGRCMKLVLFLGIDDLFVVGIFGLELLGG